MRHLVSRSLLKYAGPVNSTGAEIIQAIFFRIYRVVNKTGFIKTNCKFFKIENDEKNSCKQIPGSIGI